MKAVSANQSCTIGFLNQDLLPTNRKMLFSPSLWRRSRNGGYKRQIEKVLHKLETEYADDLVDKLTSLQEKFEHLDGYSMQAKAEEVLEGIGFTTQDLHRPVKGVLRGWRMRSCWPSLLRSPLCSCWMKPTNHLDLPSTNGLKITCAIMTAP